MALRLPLRLLSTCSAYTRRRVGQLVLLGLLALLLIPGAVQAARPEPTGRVVVLTDWPRPAGVTHARLSAVLSRHGLRRSSRVLGPLGAAVVSPRPGEGLTALRRRLARDPRVVAVEPEYRRRLRLVPDDPAYGTPDPNAPQSAPVQWNLQRQGFAEAWQLSKGHGVVVGVVDSGIDGSHPDFQGRIAGGRDQDPNGLHSDDPLVDENGHGTHVSGLACGTTGNAYGIASAGYDCQILMEKINGALIGDDEVSNGIVDATDRGAKVINLSLGGPGESTLIARAVAYAAERDVVLVAAAANEAVDDQGVPAKYVQPATAAGKLDAGLGLVVTAAEFDDTRADFAGLGPQISIAAYGHSSDDTAGIFSTFPAATTELETGLTVPPEPPCLCRAELRGDSRFAYLSGTSMATPQVSGAAALVRSLNPPLGAAEVVRILKESARRAGGWSAELGWGILDAGKAVQAAAAIDRDAPVSKVTTRRRTRSRRVTVRIRGRDKRRPGVLSSGIARYDVFLRTDGSKRLTLVKSTPRGAYTFNGRRGHRYEFFSRAIDKAGNVEPAPARADSTTRIVRRR